jgi:predicted DNA-binding protein
MAIVTLRLNDEEEKILELLVKYFDADKSKILKEAMWDKYEDLRDQEIIEEFEKKERAGKAKFETADDLIQAISQKKKTKHHS